MPAKKPASLVVRDETKAERQRRDEQAKALTPGKSLSVRPPAQLTGEVARSAWQETIRLYLTLDARIVSVLDLGLLRDYCIVCEQMAEIDELRAVARNNYSVNQALLVKALMDKKDATDLKILTKLSESVNRCFDKILRLDARADGKRKLVHSYRQSLMLTPRSRGGVNPEEKQKEEPQSAMGKILDGEVKKTRKKNV
jgi:hypothetical protein